MGGGRLPPPSGAHAPPVTDFSPQVKICDWFNGLTIQNKTKQQNNKQYRFNNTGYPENDVRSFHLNKMIGTTMTCMT